MPDDERVEESESSGSEYGYAGSEELGDGHYRVFSAEMADETLGLQRWLETFRRQFRLLNAADSARDFGEATGEYLRRGMPAMGNRPGGSTTDDPVGGLGHSSGGGLPAAPTESEGPQEEEADEEFGAYSTHTFGFWGKRRTWNAY